MKQLIARVSPEARFYIIFWTVMFTIAAIGAKSKVDNAKHHGATQRTRQIGQPNGWHVYSVRGGHR